MRCCSRRLLFWVWLVLSCGLGEGAADDLEVDWTGAWDTRWRDGGAALYLQQDGDLVTGSYPVLDGTVTGETRGELLVGEWVEPGGSGAFVFSMAPDRQSFMGRFGSGEWWTGARLPPGEIGGEVTADASSPRAALFSFVAAGNAARDGRIDRLGPALAVLDFSDLPSEATDTPTKRLELAQRLFEVLDLLTFRVWALPNPGPDDRVIDAPLSQVGTGEAFTLQVRYQVRANGAAGWLIVVPPAEATAAARERLLAMLDGEPYHSREHEELRTPRDTMRTFLEQWQRWQATGDHDLLFRTLDLSGISATARDDEAAQTAQYLKEVIDRIGYVLWQELPNDPNQRGAYTHFVHPAGRVEIGPVATADGGRVWQFTRETVEAARSLYIALEDMPLDERVEPTSSTLYLDIRDTMRAVDSDLLDPVLGAESWQWLVLALGLVISVPLGWLVTWVIFRLILRMERGPDEMMSVRLRFMWPLQAVLIAGLGWVTLRLLGLPEVIDVPLRVLIGIVLSVAGGWLAYHLIDKLGSLAGEASGRFHYRDEMLRSLAIAFAKVGVVVGALLFLAEVLSIPYQGVFAGLGLGGLAVALAARSTIENFIGGLTLLADKPIQVGDFCRFGDQIGTVEGIGLRSVKIRSLDRTVITIPNGDFVNLYIENYARRDSILLRTTLQLRYETTPDQLRWVLANLRKLMIQHPRVLAEPSRARLIGFGAHSLDIEVFAYVETSDWNEYLSIQEDLYLRMIDVVEHAGTGFAFPSTINYLSRDRGLDAERTEAAQASVARWRDRDRMPFPEFDEDERWGMFNQLEYPPPGSPHSRAAQDRRGQKPEAAD